MQIKSDWLLKILELDLSGNILIFFCISKFKDLESTLNYFTNHLDSLIATHRLILPIQRITLP
ncbi:hypothetical protein HPMG_01712 [Helicobacter pullorum MIT 98-5489]|uniref:Uncharacterized protein n=1 Tax=Helicobacter pullorum MIT 98-5489 TaxID=537972 RepID=C5F1W1_9HELI|nr:hypothetical protein HPMG_01712 [Helicobacter pullorum MIT 98-5489]